MPGVNMYAMATLVLGEMAVLRELLAAVGALVRLVVGVERAVVILEMLLAVEAARAVAADERFGRFLNERLLVVLPDLPTTQPYSSVFGHVIVWLMYGNGCIINYLVSRLPLLRFARLRWFLSLDIDDLLNSSVMCPTL